MKHYLQSSADVFTSVSSSENGLTSKEAEKRLEADGKNKLKEGKKISVFARFLNQLKDPMIIILIVAAVISAVTGFIEAKNSGQAFVPSDTIIILVVVLINAILGVVQESKAESAIEALQEMAAATTKVIRDGKHLSVKSEDLVKGDVIILEAGDAVPADCRIFECASMKVEEAALTGESVPVNKTDETLESQTGEVALGDRKNMVYMGSTVVYGRGKAVVVGTGMDTEMGKIADAIAQAEDSETPLQKKLNQLSKVLTWLVLGICVFIFAFQIVMSLVNGNSITFDLALTVFMTAVSLAVAAIPEGLAAVVTIVLSMGVTNMSKKNAIIRKLTAVETLGCAQIICSDKTGTLTQNKMTVVDHYGEDENEIARAMALCCDAELDENNEAIGEPTEAALVNYGYKLGIDGREKSFGERIGEVPFDSGRKMMSVVIASENGLVQYTKGAPDIVISRCTKALVGGEIVPFTEDLKAQALKANKTMADRALRVLAASKKILTQKPDEYTSEALENDLVFVGLTGMIDPVRPEVKAAIEQCRSAGITPIMITGDHKDTAVAIAKELGIIEDESQAITGAQLDEISEEDFEEKVATFRVYARVQPEHKTRIVTAWKKRGMITAMTGDGVNDAPSIKSADIGVGMGITGTDVTKNVADMVLADDNFATIVGAVAEGRRIYDNIRKAIQFLLGSNLSEVLSVFISSMLSFTILKPPHLLFINLITDCFPALALGLEKEESNLMNRKPRSSKDGIFAGGMGIDCLYQGILVTILTLAAFFIGEYHETGKWIFMNIAESNNGMTMAFLTMSMAEIFHSFNLRSQRGSVLAMAFKQHSHNKWLYLSMAASLILTTLVIEVPFLASAFGFVELGIKDYAISLALAISVIPIVEIIKAIQRAAAKKKAN